MNAVLRWSLLIIFASCFLLACSGGGTDAGPVEQNTVANFTGDLDNDLGIEGSSVGPTDGDIVGSSVGPVDDGIEGSGTGPIEGQVELGPVIKALVEVFDTEDLTKPVCTSTTVDSRDLEVAGTFVIPAGCIKADRLYLLQASGGFDIDVDDDGILNEDDTDDDNNGVTDNEESEESLDKNSVAPEKSATQTENTTGTDQDSINGADASVDSQIIGTVDIGKGDEPGVSGPKPVNGIVRTLMTTQQLQTHSSKLRISALTEFVFEAMQYSLVTKVELDEIIQTMDFIAPLMLKNDINGDGELTATDMILWDPSVHGETNMTPEQMVKFVQAVHDGKNTTIKEIKSYDRLVSHLDTLSRATYVKVFNGYAYMGTANSLLIVDIKDSKKPEIIGSFPTGVIKEIVVTESTAFISLENLGIQIIDIRDKRKPKLIKYFADEKAGHLAASDEKLLYLNLQDKDGVLFLQLNMISNFDGYGSIDSLTVGGNLTDLNNMFGRHNQANPEATLNLIDEVFLMVDQTSAYVSGLFAIHVIDITNSNHLSEIGRSATENSGVGGFYAGVFNKRLYIKETPSIDSDEYVKLSVIDFSNPKMPTFIKTITTPCKSAIGDIALSDGLLVGKCDSHIYFWDEMSMALVDDIEIRAFSTQSENKNSYGSLNSRLWDGLGDEYNNFDFENGFAYFALGRAGLQIVDFGDIRVDENIIGSATLNNFEVKVTKHPYAESEYEVRMPKRSIVDAHIEAFNLYGQSEEAACTVNQGDYSEQEVIGEIFLKRNCIEKNSFYRIVIKGGYTIETDDNGGVIARIPINGELNAILSSEDILASNWFISSKSEYIYQRVKSEIKNGITKNALRNKLSFEEKLLTPEKIVELESIRNSILVGADQQEINLLAQRINPYKIEHKSFEQSVDNILVADKNIFVAINGGVSVLERETLKEKFTVEELTSFETPPFYGVTDTPKLMQYNDNTLYLKTNIGKVSKLDISDPNHITRSVLDSDRFINSLITDKNGTIIVGTKNEVCKLINNSAETLEYSACKIINEKALGNNISINSNGEKFYSLYEELIPGIPVLDYVRRIPPFFSNGFDRPFFVILPSQINDSWLKHDKDFREEEELIYSVIEDRASWESVDKEKFSKYGVDISDNSVTFSTKDLIYANYFHYFQGMFRADAGGSFIYHMGYRNDYYQKALKTQIRLIDPNNDTQPQIVIEKIGQQIDRIELVGDLLYLVFSFGENSIEVYDVKDRANPVLLRAYLSDRISKNSVFTDDLKVYSLRTDYYYSGQDKESVTRTYLGIYKLDDVEGAGNQDICIANDGDKRCVAYEVKRYYLPDISLESRLVKDGDKLYIAGKNDGMIVVDLSIDGDTVVSE